MAESESKGLDTHAMLDRDELRFLTEHFNHLQGLRMIPFGLLFLSVPFLRTQDFDARWVAGMLGVAMLLYAAIGVYYNRTFGRVRRRAKSQIRDVAVIAAFVLTTLGAIAFEKVFDPPLSLVGLLIAGLLLYVYRTSAGRRHYYAAVAGVFVFLSCLPLIGLATSSDVFGKDGGMGDFAVGIMYLVLGILDHKLLLRHLRPVPVEADGSAF